MLEIVFQLIKNNNHTVLNNIKLSIYLYILTIKYLKSISRVVKFSHIVTLFTTKLISVMV